MADDLNTYLTLSGALFAIGTFGFLARRNAISMLMSIELMLNAVNLAIVAFGSFNERLGTGGSVIALLVIAVAVAWAIGMWVVFNALTGVEPFGEHGYGHALYTWIPSGAYKVAADLFVD